jgi:hypothetical protein
VNVARFLIYASVLALPVAGDAGTDFITYGYIALLLLLPVLQVLTTNPAAEDAPRFPPNSTLYLVYVVVFLMVNFIVGQMNGVSPAAWASRSVHLALIVVSYVSFRYSRIDPVTLLRDLRNIGILETIVIYGTYIAYLDPRRRAADIEGTIIYSICIIVAAYWYLREYATAGGKKPLFAYVAILFAVILTGSRGLIVSVAVMPLAMRANWRLLVFYFMAGIAAIPLLSSGLLARFELNPENLVTVFGKVREVEQMLSFFGDHPITGVGIGKAYRVPFANSDYTYTHNMVAFYLGYGGLLGIVAGLYPFWRLLRSPAYRLIAFSALLFYMSTTAYTTVRHSLTMGLALLLAESLSRQPARNPSRYRPADGLAMNHG